MSYRLMSITLGGLWALMACGVEPAVLQVTIGIEEPVREDVDRVVFRVEHDGIELRQSERAATDYLVGQTRDYLVFVENEPLTVDVIVEGIEVDGSVGFSQRRTVTLDFFGATRSIEMALRCGCRGRGEVASNEAFCTSEACGSCTVGPEGLLSYNSTGLFSDGNASFVNACGGCDQNCSSMRHIVGPVCRNQECDYSSCGEGFADCDGVTSNGCESSLNSGEHCGACGNSASATQICVNGSLVDETGEPVVCPDDEEVCGRACVSTADDVDHCGGCDRVCGSENTQAVRCVEGSCASECLSGFADCNMGAPDNFDGCETQLNQIDNCGRCGVTCMDRPNVRRTICSPSTGSEGATFICVAYECNNRTGDCVTDYPNEDGVVPDDIAGCETPLDTTSNCGVCGRACRDTEDCVEGRCTATVKPPSSVGGR